MGALRAWLSLIVGSGGPLPLLGHESFSNRIKGLGVGSEGLSVRPPVLVRGSLHPLGVPDVFLVP